MTTTTEKTSTPLLHKATCPRCDEAHARRSTQTSELVYLRCEGCGFTWPIADRRKRAFVQPAKDAPQND